MSSIHLHLLLNHVPVIGTMLGVLLLAIAVARRSDELGRIALWLFALLAGTSILVFLTGEPAEELVEKLPGFSEALTERHEEAALVATIVVGLVGVFSLAVLAVFRKRPLARWATPIALALSLGAAAAMGYAANLGGQIRHTEIRAATTAMPDRAGDEYEGRER